MVTHSNRLHRTLASAWLAIACLFCTPAMAQMISIDPDAGIDADLTSEPGSAGNWDYEGGASVSQAPAVTASAAPAVSTAATETTYQKDDLIGAAQGVFGKGSQGLATMIEDILRKQGEPNGYIVGREGGGAFIFGLRYGSGMLHHKVEGQRPVYWAGPSVGIDGGASAGKAFVLVYNLYDTQDLYHRFVSGESQTYLVGGFNVSYLVRGDTVLIPVRMGAGLRLGGNLGYMKFSENQRWLPF